MFKKIIIGGSFDLLHIGHKRLIAKAFESGGLVSIGITTDNFNKKRKKQTFEDQELRVKNLKGFLKKNGFIKRSEIILINDIFGTSLTNSKLEAIVVSKETIPNANLINAKRIRKEFPQLEIIILPHEKDESGKIISSTRIRNGEINTEGKIYKKLLLKIADKKLNPKTLNKFKDPLGSIKKSFKGVDKLSEIITIGDVVTQEAFKVGINPKLSVIDLKTKRQSVILNAVKDLSRMRVPNKLGDSSDSSSLQNDKTVNPAGQISKPLILKIEKAIKGKRNQLIIVKGEEDLAAIPAILFAPLGAKVYYGQPNKGMVEVLVDLKIKDKLLSLLGLQ